MITLTGDCLVRRLFEQIEEAQRLLGQPLSYDGRVFAERSLEALYASVRVLSPENPRLPEIAQAYDNYLAFRGYR